MAMDIGSGIMLPVDTEGDKIAVVPKSAKRADESGIVRFGVFFYKDPHRGSVLSTVRTLVIIWTRTSRLKVYGTYTCRE